MQNKFQESVRAYTQSIELSPDSSECHFNLASALSDLADYDKAIAHYQRSASLDPSNVEAINCLASLYEKIGNTEEAKKAYETALQVQP